MIARLIRRAMDVTSAALGCGAGIMRNLSPMISSTRLAHSAAPVPNLNVRVSESSALSERIRLSALTAPRH
jgi:hypothetical protein